jgi:hypothetical protein
MIKKRMKQPTLSKRGENEFSSVMIASEVRRLRQKYVYIDYN